MGVRRIEKWTWLLIYGGLLLASLGLFVLRGAVGNAGMGWAMVVGGVVGLGVGVVLVVLRSRMPDVPELPTES